MEVGMIAMRYAKALIAFATERGVEERVYEELKLLQYHLFTQPELQRMIDNPVLPDPEKLSLLRNAAGIETSEEYIRFMELLLSKHREKYVCSICLTYADLYRKAKNISLGSLTTACTVSKEEEDRMKQMVVNQTHGTVEFQSRVDPAIEGGFIFQINTYRMDASVATQFKRVKRQFIEKNRRIV